MNPSPSNNTPRFSCFVASRAALAAVTALLGASGHAAAQCYVYRSNLPDFDQRRIDAFPKVGLPWNGSVHCVPTSWADNFAYLANHGMPELTYDLQHDWKSHTSYNFQTFMIYELGLWMGTTQEGGTSNGVGPLIELMNERAPGKLVFGSKSHDGVHPPSPRFVYEVLAAGGFATVGRGFYQKIPQTTLHIRTGGHINAVKHVYDGCTNYPEIGMRNPATQDSMTVNSPWATHRENLEKTTGVFISGDNVNAYTYWKWVQGSSPTLVKILDGFSFMLPTIALTEGTVLGTEPKVEFIRPLSLTDPVRPTHGQATLPIADGTVKSILIDPSLAFCWAITEDPTQGMTICRIGMGSGTVETKVGVGDLVLAASAISHNGQIYVAGGRELRRYRLDADENMYQDGRVMLPYPVQAMAEDDTAGELVVLLAAPGGPALCRQPLDLAAPSGPVFPCPPGTGVIGDVALATDARSGEVLFCSTGVESIFRLAPDSAGGWTLIETIALPPGAEPRNPHRTDVGSVVFTSNGVVFEYEQDESGAWQPKTNSLYAGREVGNIFVLATSRPASAFGVVFDGDQTNIAVEEVDETRDCPADFAGNNAVEVPDIFAFLSAWFAGEPAAFEYGGTPGVPAIFAFLTDWFAGCE